MELLHTLLVILCNPFLVITLSILISALIFILFGETLSESRLSEYYETLIGGFGMFVIFVIPLVVLRIYFDGKENELIRKYGVRTYAVAYERHYAYDGDAYIYKLVFKNQEGEIVKTSIDIFDEGYDDDEEDKWPKLQQKIGIFYMPLLPKYLLTLENQGYVKVIDQSEGTQKKSDEEIYNQMFNKQNQKK